MASFHGSLALESLRALAIQQGGTLLQHLTREGFADPILRKLDSALLLSGEDREAISALPLQITDIGKDHDMVREGDRPTRCFVMLEGFAHGYKTTREGFRQITNVYVAGDMPDLQSLHLDALDVSFAATTACKVAFIPHDAIRNLCSSRPQIAGAFWRQTLIDGAISREWTMNLGQRPAMPRLAHFFCEFMARMNAVGLTSDQSCGMPMRQSQLGEAMGLSSVHVNRSIQNLRATGMMALRQEQLSVWDWPGLQRFADFDPSYLHLRSATISGLAGQAA